MLHIYLQLHQIHHQLLSQDQRAALAPLHQHRPAPAPSPSWPANANANDKVTRSCH